MAAADDDSRPFALAICTLVACRGLWNMRTAAFTQTEMAMAKAGPQRLRSYGMSSAWREGALPLLAERALHRTARDGGALVQEAWRSLPSRRSP